MLPSISAVFLTFHSFDPFHTSHTSHDITRIPLSCWPPDARLFARRVACSKSKSSTPCKGDLPKRKAGRKNRSCEKMDENGLMMLAWLILTVHIFFGLFHSFSTLLSLTMGPWRWSFCRSPKLLSKAPQGGLSEKKHQQLSYSIRESEKYTLTICNIYSTYRIFKALKPSQVHGSITDFFPPVSQPKSMSSEDRSAQAGQKKRKNNLWILPTRAIPFGLSGLSHRKNRISRAYHSATFLLLFPSSRTIRTPPSQPHGGEHCRSSEMTSNMKKRGTIHFYVPMFPPPMRHDKQRIQRPTRIMVWVDLTAVPYEKWRKMIPTNYEASETTAP